jgi:6-pyruvoyltetrahydropterin/6-carboxytetrahydropterin synthase
MVRLTRTVRVTIDQSGVGDAPPRVNAGGTPTMAGLGRSYEFDVECRGEPDGASGYLVDIKVIDRAVRESIGPLLARACAGNSGADPAQLIRDWGGALGAALPGLQRLRWRLTPWYSVETNMNRRDEVVIRQQFEFAAAHRLHVAGLSDEENRRLFGKCNNPAGHGHNYRLEPAVAVRAEAGRPPRFCLTDLERETMRVIVDRFDHTHLNQDTREFGAGGVNPSVENIARVCFELLGPAIERASEGSAVLRQVVVWETDRTSAAYPG